jgi:alpha-beta hydrolase superfamily lysophospholipase
MITLFVATQSIANEDSPKSKKVLDASSFTGVSAGAYKDASEFPALMSQLFCYSGDDLTDNHKTLLDCFRSTHGAGEYICQAEVNLAARLYRQGLSVKDIQEEVDKQFSNAYPFETDTKAYSSYKEKIALVKSFYAKLPTIVWCQKVFSLKPAALALCLHDMGLSGISFDDFADKLSQKGFIVCAVDLPGFGSLKTKEPLSGADFDASIKDIENTLLRMRAAFPGVPICIVGEGYGATLALASAARKPRALAGVIVSSPADSWFAKPEQEDIVKSMCQFSADKYTHIRSSPLNRANLGDGSFNALRSFMGKGRVFASQIKQLPVMAMVGAKDRFSRPVASMAIFNALGTPDRVIEVVHGQEHLILEQDQLDEHTADLIAAWIEKHVR